MNACVFVLLCLALANLGFSSYKRWNVGLDYELAASFLLEKDMWRVESEMEGVVWWRWSRGSGQHLVGFKDVGGHQLASLKVRTM
jgi:hypothetical protein